MIKLGRFCSIRGSEESQMLVIFVHNRGERKIVEKIRWNSVGIRGEISTGDKDFSIFSFYTPVLDEKRGC